MEGWNSWRVSNMGLLNIGRQEGSQIIQFFGRGVRLRGKGFSLKRSAALDGTHPEHMRLLETLNIFAVRANYMAQFRDYLEKEGVETEEGGGVAAFHLGQQGIPAQGTGGAARAGGRAISRPRRPSCWSPIRRSRCALICR